MRVSFQNFDEKLEVMKKKAKFKSQECYLDSDMTKQEREIQAAIRQRAREERGKGNSVEVGYQKLQINGNSVNWPTRSSTM